VARLNFVWGPEEMTARQKKEAESHRKAVMAAGVAV
jgi:hypothetical protein